MSTVVITGANRGLGLELAREFAGRGHTVVGTCRHPGDAAELAAVAAEVHPLDVGNESSIDAFVAALGDRVVDVLVHNAGVDARAFGATNAERNVFDQTAEQFMGQIRVNALGPMLLTRSLIAHLRRSERPRVVSISSQLGSMEVAQKIGGDVGYGASKAAMNVVTLKLGAALRDDGISCVMFHPGWLRTDMGGSSAAMAADDSARQLADQIDALNIDDTMTFRRWDGSPHPW